MKSNDIENITDLLNKLGMDDEVGLDQILVNNTRGNDLVSIESIDSDSKWLVIRPIYPWEKNEYYGMTADRIVNLFLDSIKHFVVEDIGLKSKMRYIEDIEVS